MNAGQLLVQLSGQTRVSALVHLRHILVGSSGSSRRRVFNGPAQIEAGPQKDWALLEQARNEDNLLMSFALKLLTEEGL